MTVSPGPTPSSADALAKLGRIARQSRFPYATSCPIDEITLVTHAGQDLAVLLKQQRAVDRRGPASLRDAGREPLVYRLLAAQGIPAPRCLGAGDTWLLIERVDGAPLWQEADLDAWAGAARWAAGVHAAFAAAPPESASLLVRDADFFRACFERALADDSVRARRGVLEAGLEQAITRLGALAPTLIHGELYPSNVIVGDRDVVAVDFEMAGLGPGVIDLAALVTGWTGDARRMILSAYGAIDPDDLAAAQLALALQWLGWDESWSPPIEHRHDWLGEALAAAEVLS